MAARQRVFPGERQRMGDDGLACVVPGLCARRASSTVGSPALCRASAVQSFRSALAYVWGASFRRPACLGIECGSASARAGRGGILAAWGWRIPILHPVPYAVRPRSARAVALRRGLMLLPAGKIVRALGGAVSYQ